MICVNDGSFGSYLLARKQEKSEPIMNDLQLRKDVLDELEFEPRVNAASIGVAVERGAVTFDRPRVYLS